MSDVAYFETQDIYPGGRLLTPLAYDCSGNDVDNTKVDFALYQD